MFRGVRLNAFGACAYNATCLRVQGAVLANKYISESRSLGKWWSFGGEEMGFRNVVVASDV